MAININDERKNRIATIQCFKENGIIPYAEKFEKENNLAEIQDLKLGTRVKTAGRICLLRKMGKIIFAHLQDFSGKAQVVIKLGDLKNDQEFKIFNKLVQVGDFIGVEGEIFKTMKGEISILTKKYTFLSKSLRPLPEKWKGLKDVESKYRQRYLDLISNEDTRKVFQFRSDFIWELRNFYRKYNFHEIDTPILCNTASGALAKPFVTHHNALDLDVYLRIAPEIFLKEAIIGGYERVFEIARVFRNEGTDPSHLQDFTMIEHYCAYWNFEDNMNFTEKMVSSIIKKLKGTTVVEILDKNGNKKRVDFKPPWKRVSFKDLLLKDCGIDIDKHETVESLRSEIKKGGLEIEDMDKLGRGNLIDSLYKATSRNKLVQPVFLINHPVDLSPLARRNDNKKNIVDRFQLVVNGWEIVNAYSELIDPIDQKKRFEDQAKARAGGDEEAMLKDDDYVKAMEYGLPPMSGWGMGLERIVALLTQQPNLRDVVLFPLVKPIDKENEE